MLGRVRVGVGEARRSRAGRIGDTAEGGDDKGAKQRRIGTGAGDGALYFLSLSMSNPRFCFHTSDLRCCRRLLLCE